MYTEKLTGYRMVAQLRRTDFARAALPELEGFADVANAESQGAAAMLAELIKANMNGGNHETALYRAARELDEHSAAIGALYDAIDRERKGRDHAIN